MQYASCIKLTVLFQCGALDKFSGKILVQLCTWYLLFQNLVHCKIGTLVMMAQQVFSMTIFLMLTNFSYLLHTAKC